MTAGRADPAGVARQGVLRAGLVQLNVSDDPARNLPVSGYLNQQTVARLLVDSI